MSASPIEELLRDKWESGYLEMQIRSRAPKGMGIISVVISCDASVSSTSLYFRIVRFHQGKVHHCLFNSGLAATLSWPSKPWR